MVMKVVVAGSASSSPSACTNVGEGTARRCRRFWACPNSKQVKAQLYLCHGTHEHSGRYDKLAAAFGAVGVEVHAVDFSGHGSSAGERGDFGTVEGAVSDVIALVQDTARASLPLIVLGHSLGSMMAMIVAHRLASSPSLPRPAMVVLSGFAMDSISPPFGLKFLIPVLRAMPSVIRTICAQLAKTQPTGPAAPIPSPSELTSFPERAADKWADPLNYHGWIQNRTALALLDMRATCQALLPHFGSAVSGRGFPFLLVHGGADELCPRSACDALMAKSPQPDKEMRVFAGLLHEVLDAEEARQHVVEWCRARIGPRCRL